MRSQKRPPTEGNLASDLIQGMKASFSPPNEDRMLFCFSCAPLCRDPRFFPWQHDSSLCFRAPPAEYRACSLCHQISASIRFFSATAGEGLRYDSLEQPNSHPLEKYEIPTIASRSKLHVERWERKNRTKSLRHWESAFPKGAFVPQTCARLLHRTFHLTFCATVPTPGSRLCRLRPQVPLRGP